MRWWCRIKVYNDIMLVMIYLPGRKKWIRNSKIHGIMNLDGYMTAKEARHWRMI